MPKGNYRRAIMKGYQPKESAAFFPSQPQLVSIIIPARDAANSIGNLILRIKESLSTYNHEIIVVDDGSEDGTKQVCQSTGIKVISHQTNLGKGAAIKTGIKNATGDIIVFLDSDGAHDPKDIPKVIAPILQNKADLVIGSRTLPESGVSKLPLTRKLTNSLASFIISVIISFLLPLATLFRCPVKYIKITDCTSGFRAIKKDKWYKLNLISKGFEIETEMIYEAARNRLAIADVPISHSSDNQFSRLSILRDGLKTLKLLGWKLISDTRGESR